jgi:toxin YoeB
LPARRTLFTSQFRKDVDYWAATNPKLYAKIKRLVQETARDPFTGIGKPEHLKHLLPDLWSRRISQEHRLVYLVEGDFVTFLQCRYHYR